MFYRKGLNKDNDDDRHRASSVHIGICSYEWKTEWEIKSLKDLLFNIVVAYSKEDWAWYWFLWKLFWLYSDRTSVTCTYWSTADWLFLRGTDLWVLSSSSNKTSWNRSTSGHLSPHAVTLTGSMGPFLIAGAHITTYTNIEMKLDLVRDTFSHSRRGRLRGPSLRQSECSVCVSSYL